MGNHPLNNIGWQELRTRAIIVLSKLERLIDLKIKELRDREKYMPPPPEVIYVEERNEPKSDEKDQG